VPDEAPRPAGPEDERPDQRTGEDTRRRGWYWHWNSIVTQYAPLIGLKGVGLLNSYTVWTDRREDSPHRGYAFPSQQSEAAFYGEDRAELITINKILVALDLIEVRKEMVLHVDEKGRRWRVPHNLYRVKDNPNGFTLTVEDVLRVAELASKTPAVYRYLRRVFSPNFAPIDSNNPWHQILPAVRQTETWQRLAARAAREDARASARSKAGHRKRKGKDSPPSRHDDSDAAKETSPDVAHLQGVETFVAPANTDEQIDVHPHNNGSDTDVDESNRAFDRKSPTVDGPANEGSPTVVDPANRTYNQGTVNTTRTTTGESSAPVQQSAVADPPADQPGSGPILQASNSVLVAFQSANDRPPTPLERELLGELERDFADAAERAGISVTGWVVEAIREAVNSGSRFVAPKRVREILNRWSSTQGRNLRSGGNKTTVTQSTRTRPRRDADEVGSAWRAILTELQASNDWSEIGDVLSESVLLGEEDGRIRIGLARDIVSDQLETDIRHAVEPRFANHLKRDIELDFESNIRETRLPLTAPGGEGDGVGAAAPDLSPTAPQTAPRFPIVDGLTNSQVWAAAQEELRGRISPANFETWIRPASLIGRDGDGRLVLGVPNRFAQQRVESKLTGDIEMVLSRIVGQPIEVKVVVGQQWLREQQSQ
jgi:hypothetical protein